MGAILFIIISVIAYTLKILHNQRELTFDKWCEIFISFFIFTNCIGFGLPLIELPIPITCGAWGLKFRLEVFMIITPIFFVILSQRNQWRIPPIPWYVLLGIIAFCGINIFNPNNLSVQSTIIALLQLFTYITFLYIVCSCVDSDTLLRAIFNGFKYTVIVQTILVLCFPILGMTQVVELFRENVSIRAEERPGAPGTFSHPNNLGGYIIYVIVFYASCYIMNFRKKESLIWGLASFFVLIFTFSRTALLASFVALITIVVIYITRNGRIFTLRNIFTLILPLLAGAGVLIFLTPIKDSFIGSNMDEMMLARLLHFYCGYETITEHPWIGVGLNAHLEYIRENVTFGTMFGNINRFFWRAEEFMYSHPIHNVFLIITSELGVLGLLPILFFMCYRFYNIKKVLRSNASDADKIMFLFSIGLICCISVHGMADWAPFSQQLRNIWVLAFFVTAIKKINKQPE